MPIRTCRQRAFLGSLLMGLIGLPFILFVMVAAWRDAEAMILLPHVFMAGGVVISAVRIAQLEVGTDLPRIMLDDHAITLRGYGDERLNEYAWDDIDYSFVREDDQAGPQLQLVFHPGVRPSGSLVQTVLDGSRRAVVSYSLSMLEDGHESRLRGLGAWLRDRNRGRLALPAGAEPAKAKASPDSASLEASASLLAHLV